MNPLQMYDLYEFLSQKRRLWMLIIYAYVTDYRGMLHKIAADEDLTNQILESQVHSLQQAFLKITKLHIV